MSNQVIFHKQLLQSVTHPLLTLKAVGSFPQLKPVRRLRLCAYT